MSTPGLADQLRAAIHAGQARRSETRGANPEASRLRAALKAEWAEREGLVEAAGRMNFQRLFGRRGDDRDWKLPMDDHVSMWRRPSDRGMKISRWVSQPYPLSVGAARAMFGAAAQFGLEFSISTWPAWHYPGSVLFVEWQVRGPELSE